MARLASVVERLRSTPGEAIRAATTPPLTGLPVVPSRARNEADALVRRDGVQSGEQTERNRDQLSATQMALDVLPTDVVNAADGWPVAEAAVGPPAVVVA